MMMSYPSEFIINVLRKDYPDINLEISEKIRQSLPEKSLNDLSQISVIIRSFLKAKGLTCFRWQNQPGQKKVTDTRELLLAVVLMFYHPEKIHGFTAREKKTGMVKALSELIECRQDIISKSMMSAVSAYRTYRNFREEVQRLYDVIKGDVKF